MRLKHHILRKGVLSLGCERVDSNHRPLAYEANELPLLHSAMVAGEGFEPPTSWLWAKWAAVLLYPAIFKGGNIFSVGAPTTAHERKWKPHQRLVPKVRIELTTSALWGRRSNRLSYSGIWGSFSSCPGTQSDDWSVLQSGFHWYNHRQNPPFLEWWRLQGDLNPWPPAWQAGVLTNWTMKPNKM